METRKFDTGGGEPMDMIREWGCWHCKDRRACKLTEPDKCAYKHKRDCKCIKCTRGRRGKVRR